MRDELEPSVSVLTQTAVARILTDDGTRHRGAARRRHGLRGRRGDRGAGPRRRRVAGRRSAGVSASPSRRTTSTSARASRSRRSSWSRSPSVLYESKLVYYSKHFDDQVRTFCMNPHGVVSLENYGDVVTVNGHSYSDEKTDYTNFALLVSTRFTEPFDDPIAYGKSIARLANLLGEDIIVQRLGDLQVGKRSTPERIARGTVQPTLSRGHAWRPLVRAALPPPARHPRHARGDGRARAGRERARHAALRRRGQVLLGAATARCRVADRDQPTSTRWATAPGSRAAWCRRRPRASSPRRSILNGGHVSATPADPQRSLRHTRRRRPHAPPLAARGRRASPALPTATPHR